MKKYEVWCGGQWCSSWNESADAYADCARLRAKFGHNGFVVIENPEEML